MLFAETDPAVPATVWTAIIAIASTIGGVVMLFLRQRDKAEIRRQERQKEYREELARQKAEEVVKRAEELAAIKATRLEEITAWKDIAKQHRIEKDDLKKQLEQKFAECVELRIEVAELKQKLGDSHAE
jgi:hypothetical protein